MNRLWRVVSCWCGIAATIAAAQPILAQTFPSKTVRFIVPYSAGGATDILARALGQKLAESWGQPVVVDNRAGAGGMIGTELIAKSPPDGHTIGLAHAGPLAINPSLYRKLPYSPATDFTYISLMGRQENIVVVHPSLPARSIRELVALAKARPGEITIGSGGSGTGSHLAGEMFVSMTGTRMLHIPYKGNAPSVIALLSGEVQVMFPTILTVKPHIEAARLRALAVTTEKRVGAMPDVPTVAEAGVPGYESSIWFGAMGPAGMPADVVHKLNAEVVRILALPDFKATFVSQGLDIQTSSADAFTRFVRAEQEKWAKVIRSAGIQAQ